MTNMGDTAPKSNLRTALTLVLVAVALFASVIINHLFFK